MQDPQDAIKTPPLLDDLSGLQVGRFTVDAQIGSGGMGQVYRAHDTMLKRVVAIKRMAPHMHLTQLGRDRFLREAQRASALNHPNIASIFDVFEERGEVFLVMEYIEGTTLRQQLGVHKFTIDEFFPIAIQCGEALAMAHQHQILHGDIKPENIMLTPGNRVKILDFGVARRMADPGEATQSLATMTGSLAGTPAYMAPEVLEQKPYDGRADLFSLGLVFYEVLGGPQPFATDSFAGTLGRVLHTDPKPITEVHPEIPASVGGVVGKLLKKDPAERYPSAGVLVTELQIAQQGGTPQLALAGAAKPVSRKPARAPLIFGIVLGIAVLAGLGLLLSSRLRHPQATRQAAGAPALPQTRVLAVLPFTSDDPKLAALGRGLLDSVAARLSRLSEDRTLVVIPARDLSEKGIATLADARKQFGANVGLTVELRQSQELVKVTYSLLDARSGQALGGDSVTLPASDVFAVEDNIAQGTIKALQLHLRSEDEAALRVHGTSQPAAYNYYLQARGYLLNFTSAENVENAILMIREALKLDPNFGMAKAALGEAYWRKYWHTKQPKWTQLAKQECEAAVKLGNAGASGHTCLGLVNDGTGNYREAATEYQRAVDLEPTSEDAYIGLALANEHLGAITKAEQTYQTAMEIHPQSWVAANALGNFYYRRNEYDKAIQMFQKVTELAPEGYAGYVNLGAAHSNMTRYSDAIAPLKKSIVLRPTYAAYVNLGTAYFGLRDYKQAAIAYEEATNMDAKQYVTWGNLGEARYYSGAKSEAMPAYRKATELAAEELKVNPHDTDVLGDLANYYSMLGQRDEALRYLEQALQYGRNDKQVLAVAAFVHNQLGETGLALEWLTKALQAGYPPENLRNQPGLQNLNGNPRFQELFSKSLSSK